MDESDGLENRCGRKVTVGSNPTSSAAQSQFLPVGGDPGRRATPPSTHQAEPTPPTVDQILRLVAAAQETNPDLASLIFVAATTGCRRGELCGLQWSDIDFERAEVVVRRSVSDVPGNLEVRTTKTGRVRRLAFDPATATVLDEQLRRARVRAHDAGTTLGEDAYVWSQSSDSLIPWRPDRVTGVFGLLRDRLGLDVRFHHFRHFAATMMLAGGVDVRTAAGRLGHAQPAVTLKTYAHVLQAPDRVAAELLGSALTPITEAG